MSILGANDILGAYQYANKAPKTATSGTSFADEVQKAGERQSMQTKSTSSAWAGDLVVPQPPNYSGFTYDSSISGKSREEMTMDEYKQWFMHEMQKMPLSAYFRSTIVGGELTITEECFERMKSDPEWETTVLGMVRKMYSAHGIMGSRAIGYQVIGATPEQCHGEGIPVKDGFLFSAGNKKSWWEIRYEMAKKRRKAQEGVNLL